MLDIPRVLKLSGDLVRFSWRLGHFGAIMLEVPITLACLRLAGISDMRFLHSSHAIAPWRLVIKHKTVKKSFKEFPP